MMQTIFIRTERLPTNEHFMKRTKHSTIGLVFGSVILGAFTGCIGYVDGPRHERVHAQPQPVYVETGVVVHDDYVYYPGYQVYYSGNTQRYVYLEGRSWVSRSAPPRVSVDVLFASPSVRLDFHDAPAAHHATVARTYPKTWTPPGWSHGNKGGNKEAHKDNKEKGN
jgi:hypothetical protein